MELSDNGEEANRHRSGPVSTAETRRPNKWERSKDRMSPKITSRARAETTLEEIIQMDESAIGGMKRKWADRTCRVRPSPEPISANANLYGEMERRINKIRKKKKRRRSSAQR